MRIREACARDALELVALKREVFAEGSWFITTSGENAYTVEDQAAEIASITADQGAALFVARASGKVVGFLQLRPPPFLRMKHVVKLEIMVRSAARGTGVGQQLLQAGIEWARSSGIKKIGLNVFADNERAIKLYQRYGFEEEGRRVREYFLPEEGFRDDLLMALFL